MSDDAGIPSKVVDPNEPWILYTKWTERADKITRRYDGAVCSVGMDSDSAQIERGVPQLMCPECGSQDVNGWVSLADYYLTGEIRSRYQWTCLCGANVDIQTVREVDNTWG